MGSSSYLTDHAGIPTHYYNNLPFGETFYEENHAQLDNMYKFKTKELDQSTGLYYYGARYEVYTELVEVIQK